MILSMSAKVFFSLAPSPTPENFGAAVVASVAIIAVVTANSASDCPFLLFNRFSIFIMFPLLVKICYQQYDTTIVPE